MLLLMKNDVVFSMFGTVFINVRCLKYSCKLCNILLPIKEKNRPIKKVRFWFPSGYQRY